jgi:peptidoglycan/LPS O-acetylase OafA/YrhL
MYGAIVATVAGWKNAPPDSVPESRPTYRADIQGLRAVAVVLVILDHAGTPGFEGGFIGVDIFFVISGYVITSLLMRQPPRRVRANLREFYTRRICRIVPAATLVLILTTIAASVALGENMDPALFGDVRWASLFSANFRFIQTSSGYFIPGVPQSLVTQYWSLAVEEQFYLVFPLLVFALTWFTSARRRVPTLAGVLVIAIIISSWWSSYLTPINQLNAYYSPFTRFWELALGAVVALVPKHLAGRTPRLNQLAAGAAVVVIVVCVFSFDSTSQYPGLVAWWPCAATAVLLWTGTAGSRLAPWLWLTQRPAVYVGDISYSLYLFHFVWLILPLQLAHPPASWWAVPVELIGTVVCSVASYHLIEDPIRRSRRIRGDFVSVLLLLVACVTAAWATTIVVAHLVNLT